MARLYSNENFPIPVVEELRKLGHDVLTIQETGKADQSLPDDQVLNEASSDKRAVLTFNRKHFVTLHNANARHQGIIVCSFDTDFVALAKRIDQTIKFHKKFAGKLLRINRPSRS